jgi:hypothetical protein
MDRRIINFGASLRNGRSSDVPILIDILWYSDLYVLRKFQLIVSCGICL